MTETASNEKISRIDYNLLLPDTESTDRARKLVVVAIAVHLILFFVHFPAQKEEIIAQKEPPKPTITVLKIIPPPKVPPPKVQQVEKKIKIAIPDPTPDEPEPIREPEPEEIIPIPEGVIVQIGIPTGPPAPVGPIMGGTAGTTKPIKIRDVEPVYPEAAKRVGLEGVVILQLVIDESGNVSDVKVIQQAPMGMTESAVEAVWKWKYQPSTLHGRPITVWITQTVRFKLER